MPKFLVTVDRTLVYDLVIDAPTRTQAAEIAENTDFSGTEPNASMIDVASVKIVYNEVGPA